MKVVVIGAMGQLGREIMRLSVASEHIFKFADLAGDGDVVMPLDITDYQRVYQFIDDDVDVVVNCAAYNEVEKAEDDDTMAMEINAHAVSALAEIAKKKDALLIHFSTDYVFDGQLNVPYKECFLTSPLNAYGRSKVAGEEAVLESGCRYMIFRTSWLYSIHGKNFFKTIAAKCAENASLNVVVDQVGTPTSAYDLASLVLYIIDNEMLDKVGMYHYSNEGVASWYDFAKEINDCLGYTCCVHPCSSSEFPTKALRPSYSVLDKGKVKRTFGVEVPHWRESLNMVILDYEKCD